MQSSQEFKKKQNKHYLFPPGRQETDIFFSVAWGWRFPYLKIIAPCPWTTGHDKLVLNVVAHWATIEPLSHTYLPDLKGGCSGFSKVEEHFLKYKSVRKATDLKGLKIYKIFFRKKQWEILVVHRATIPLTLHGCPEPLSGCPGRPDTQFVKP